MWKSITVTTNCCARLFEIIFVTQMIILHMSDKSLTLCLILSFYSSISVYLCVPLSLIQTAHNKYLLNYDNKIF